MKTKYLNGIVGGLAGGVVFGIVMGIMGMMPMIANLVGSDSAFVGWVVHLILSMIIGVFYAWWFAKMTTSTMKGVGYGMLHGIIWWIVGGLTIMPLLLGMSVNYANAFEMNSLLSLAGHLMYGVTLGVVYYAMAKSDVHVTA